KVPSVAKSTRIERLSVSVPVRRSALDLSTASSEFPASSLTENEGRKVHGDVGEADAEEEDAEEAPGRGERVREDEEEVCRKRAEEHRLSAEPAAGQTEENSTLHFSSKTVADVDILRDVALVRWGRTHKHNVEAAVPRGHVDDIEQGKGDPKGRTLETGKWRIQVRVGDLHRAKKQGIMKQKFTAILQHHAIPCGQRLIHANFTMQQHNTPKHTSKLYTTYLPACLSERDLQQIVTTVSSDQGTRLSYLLVPQIATATAMTRGLRYMTHSLRQNICKRTVSDTLRRASGSLVHLHGGWRGREAQRVPRRHVDGA
ncbi:hypothetical protein Z043_112103, partial [Scleropages formosus]